MLFCCCNVGVDTYSTMNYRKVLTKLKLRENVCRKTERKGLRLSCVQLMYLVYWAFVESEQEGRRLLPLRFTGTCFIQKMYAPSSSLLQGEHLPFSFENIKIHSIYLDTISITNGHDQCLDKWIKKKTSLFLFSFYRKIELQCKKTTS
jgi:hypothetical protein